MKPLAHGLGRAFRPALRRLTERAVQRRRRFVLWAATYGIDLDTRTIHPHPTHHTGTTAAARSTR